MLTPLSDVRTKELEQTTVPYMNVISKVPRISISSFQFLSNVLNWYNDNITLMNSSLYKKVKYLIIFNN